jgi:hypothetical protein
MVHNNKMKGNTMKFMIILLLISWQSPKAEGSGDLIFKTGFERFVQKLNDTGVLFAGEYPSGNRLGCATNVTEQDCHVGADSIFDPEDNGIGGFNFTKLDINGNTLDAIASIWSCVQDNITGLVWEVKTTGSASIHHTDNTYQWGGLTAIGRNHANSQGVYSDDWNDLITGSNNNNFCGFNNWRIPTPSELTSISFKSSFTMAIDTAFFPNAQVSIPYWSASPVAGDENKAWSVNYQAGFDLDNFRSESYAVRLVRSY